MGHPDKEYLDALCTSYVTAALNELLPDHPIWGGRGKAPQLAGSMVSVYVQLKQVRFFTFLALILTKRNFFRRCFLWMITTITYSQRETWYTFFKL
jgi:hypothetical protein